MCNPAETVKKLKWIMLIKLFLLKIINLNIYIIYNRFNNFKNNFIINFNK